MSYFDLQAAAELSLTFKISLYDEEKKHYFIL